MGCRTVNKCTSLWQTARANAGVGQHPGSFFEDRTPLEWTGSAPVYRSAQCDSLQHVEIMIRNLFMCLSLSAKDFRRPPGATGPAHQIIEPPQSAAMSQLCDVRRRRTAARWQLPPAEDHRQGQLRQSQTGQTHTDRPRGENRAQSLESSTGRPFLEDEARRRGRCEVR